MFVEIKKIINDTFFSSYGISIDFKVEKALNNRFGDVSSNIALVSSKYLKTSPRVIAENLAKSLSSNDFFEKIGAGKCNNFFCLKNL